MLVWVGEGEATAASTETELQAQPPSTDTPQPLAERIRVEQAEMESRGAADGERKTITALLADLKGSTALIEGLDPEDARAIIDPALQLMTDADYARLYYHRLSPGNHRAGVIIASQANPKRNIRALLNILALVTDTEMAGQLEYLNR